MIINFARMVFIQKYIILTKNLPSNSEDSLEFLLLIINLKLLSIVEALVSAAKPSSALIGLFNFNLYFGSVSSSKISATAIPARAGMRAKHTSSARRGAAEGAIGGGTGGGIQRRRR